MSKLNLALAKGFIFTQVIVICIGIWSGIASNWPIAFGCGVLYAAMLCINYAYKLDDYI